VIFSSHEISSGQKGNQINSFRRKWYILTILSCHLFISIYSNCINKCVCIFEANKSNSFRCTWYIWTILSCNLFISVYSSCIKNVSIILYNCVCIFSPIFNHLSHRNCSCAPNIPNVSEDSWRRASGRIAPWSLSNGLPTHRALTWQAGESAAPGGALMKHAVSFSRCHAKSNPSGTA